jgi:membrane protease YdiL (CAAX protease family)
MSNATRALSTAHHRPGLIAWIRRHPQLTFFVISFAVAWGFVPFGSFGAFGPLVAVLIVVPITQGLAGLRRLGSRLIRWRVAWYWYAIAIGVPLAVVVGSVLLTVGSGAPAPSLLATMTPWYSLLMIFAVRLVNPVDGPLGEEPGWRGFGQPSLQADRSPLTATAILAVAVTAWHLPLFVMPQFDLPPIGILTTIAVTFWYSWLLNRTGGSVLLTLIAHATQGIVQPWRLWENPATGIRENILECVLWCVVALTLVAVDWKLWRRRPEPQLATEPVSASRAETLTSASPSAHV